LCQTTKAVAGESFLQAASEGLGFVADWHFRSQDSKKEGGSCSLQHKGFLSGWKTDVESQRPCGEFAAIRMIRFGHAVTGVRYKS